jgi:hypothetical protein
LVANRAATSVYATLGVAAATLVVVGAILAGPSILECSRDPGGVGACLRDRLTDSVPVVPAPEPEQPDMIADVSSEPSVPAPTGWMDVNANEYEPLAGEPVELAGVAADITATELLPAVEPPAAIAVPPVSEFATAALAPSVEVAPVELYAPALDLLAEAASSSEPPAVDVALVGPEGQVVTVAPVPVAPIGGAAILTQPDELPAGTLTVLAPPLAEPVPVELRAEVEAAPVPEPAPVVIEFNPEYPNVLVLPPPVVGDDSSFRSLQLN